MTTRRCTLDGRQRSKAAVLAKLGRDLGWDRPLTNLDALYDVLRREIRGPFEIVWRLTPQSQQALATDFATLSATLREAAAERPDMRLEITPV